MAQNIVESIISEQQRAKGRQPLPWGLRILCVVFMINIVATLTYLIFSSRDLIAYSGANLIDWVNLVFEAVLLWMVWNRYRVARTFALVFTVLNVVVGTILHIVMKDLDIALQLVSVIPDVIIFCYFFFSKKAQEVLVEEVTFEEPEASGEAADELPEDVGEASVEGQQDIASADAEEGAAADATADAAA